ncbi:hypothetical protein A9Q96_06525 [Rhodobacterales bacterium 52_120_T64]|nr:hypothetical protein A9Q96_06525 [Rhodobacterales bacterium 52_120_T64]
MFRLSAILVSLMLTLSACAEIATDTYEGNASSGIIANFGSGGIRLRHMDALNALRVERGMQPLQLSATLNAAADTHARDMSRQQRAWNFGSDRTSPQERATRAGFNGVVRGENVAETFKSELLVLQTWLDDPASRASMLDPEATHLGYGWYQESNGKLWWVEVLGQAFPEPVIMAESK